MIGPPGDHVTRAAISPKGAGASKSRCRPLMVGPHVGLNAIKR